MFLKNLGAAISSALNRSFRRVASLFGGGKGAGGLGGGGDVDANADAMVEAIVREVVIDIINDLGDASPADTSKLISNWQATLNFIPPVIEAHKLGSKGSTRGESFRKAIEIAEKNMAGYKVKDAAIISNNVPYLTEQAGLAAAIPGIVSGISAELESKIRTAIIGN